MKRSTPGSHQKIGQPYICHQTKESLDSLIKSNVGVFQNQIKQAKITLVFHHFPSLGIKEPP